MKYIFGSESRRRLEGVHPDLIILCGIAIEHTNQDFSVFEGKRTIATQTEYVKRGVSRTMNSYHLEQDDGFSWAVDLVPYIDGRVRWDSIPAFQVVGTAMVLASERMGIPIVWGALQKYGGDWSTFNDMAHFQL